MEAERLEQYQRWLGTRWPLVGGWLRRRAVGALAADGSAGAVRALADAVRWDDGGDPGAALDALADLAAGGNGEAREALCGLAVRDGCAAAWDEVLAAGYEPREPAARALFYFLTQSWDRYQALDFDHSLLQASYDTADATLRRRIAATARQAGRLEWVEVVSGGRAGRRLGAMTQGEWQTAVGVLQDHRRCADAWRLAQEAPPRWSARLLLLLADSEWQPPAAERPAFAELLGLVRHWRDADFRAWLHCREVLQGHGDTVRCLAFTRDGRALASGGADGTVRLWSVPAGRPLARMAGHKGAVTCLAVSPDGRLVAAGGKDGGVWLWRLPGGRPLKLLKGHTGMVLCIALSPTGKVLATGGADGGVQLWHLPEGESIRTLDKHEGAILDLACAPDGALLASGAADSTVRLWSLPDGRPLKALHGHREGEADAVTCLAVSADGRTLASGGTDGVINLWALPGGGGPRALKGHFGEVSCLAFSPDGGLLLSGGGDNRLRLWDLPDGRLREAIEAHSSGVTRLAVAPDGSVVASVSGSGLGHDPSIRLWGLPDGEHRRTLYGHNRYVTSLAINPDGRHLASGSGDGSIRLWASELERWTDRPTRGATPDDLDRIQELLRSDSLEDAERGNLEFVAALLRHRRRHDILLDEAAPRVIAAGPFDIEIDG